MAADKNSKVDGRVARFNCFEVRCNVAFRKIFQLSLYLQVDKVFGQTLECCKNNHVLFQAQVAGFLANWRPRHLLTPGWSIFVSLLIECGQTPKR